MPKRSVIAVVDDDESIREAVTALLRSFGYDAIAFEFAEDFLKSKRRRAVDCLIADVQIPGMTGLDLYDALVAAGDAIPTVLITAYPDPLVRARALQSGVKRYLTKPFGDEDLLKFIRSALESKAVNG